MSERLYSPGNGLVPDFNRLNPSPTAPTLIGLAGYARSGKDTVAEIVQRLYGHIVLSFSDILREFLYAQDLYIPDEKGFAIRLNEVVDAIGWEDARERYQYIRVLQQKIGQEAGRETLGQDVWVNAWNNRVLALGGEWVNPSVRYPNEVEAVRNLGGVVLGVIRPGVGPVNDHLSDRALDGVVLDGLIVNDGTLADLEGEVQRVLGEFGS